MIILDENITRDQRQLLLVRGVHARQIGFDMGRSGLLDSDIVPLLLKQRECTFFSRDGDFFDRRLCHDRYCVVCLDVERDETAFFVLRFLRHPCFGTRRKRMGTVALVSQTGIDAWRAGRPAAERVAWEPA